MKLRFRENTIRLRVNRREVSNLVSGQPLEEEVCFPGGGHISYVLEPSEFNRPSASFQQDVIRIAAPRKELHEWASGEAIGMYFELPARNAPLKVSIEKDLECIEGAVDERDPDAFSRSAGKNC